MSKPDKRPITRQDKVDKSHIANKDLSNSIVRYIKNNFLDGFRQDSYDLFLGKYRVDASRPSPFSDQKITLHFILAAALAMFTSFCMLYMVLVAGSVITTRLVMMDTLAFVPWIKDV
ncbi:hypothetical protein BDV3_005194 [Batrachochytrium dendrobatidis]